MDSQWPSTAKGYKLISGLGEGFFGIVWKALILEGPNKDKYVAVKKIDLDKYADEKLEEIRKNMLLLNALDHPNLLNYKISFISRKDLWAVFEIMEVGSVEELMKAEWPKGFEDMSVVATILKETLKGIVYLHENKQIHRDIKAGNILMQNDGNVVISDFGLTAKLKKKKKEKRYTIVGSPCWMAPEVLDENAEGYDHKADIWSFGITAIEVATGKPPYSEFSAMKVILKIVSEEPPKLSKNDGWDDSFLEMLESCLIKDPSKRKSASELLKMKFFNKAKGKDHLKDKLLKNLPPFEKRIDPSIKIKAEEELKINSIIHSKSSNNIINWNFDTNEKTDYPMVEKQEQRSSFTSYKMEQEAQRSSFKKMESLSKQTSGDKKKPDKIDSLKKSGGDYPEFEDFGEEEK